MRTDLSVEDAAHHPAIAVPAGIQRRPARRVEAIARVHARWLAVPLRLRVVIVLLVGGLGAAAVGYLTALNPHAGPPRIAVALRVLIVLTLIVTGIYAQTYRLQARMGLPLIGAGMFAALWLLNGSARPFFFTVGALAAGFAPVLFSALMLSFPSGRLSSVSDRRFVMIAGEAMILPWLLLMLSTPHAPLATPLMRCGHYCADNLLSFAPRLPAFDAVLRGVFVVAWVTMSILTAWRLYRRARSAVGPLRDALVPVTSVAVLSGVLLTAYLAADAAGAPGVEYVGAAYASVALIIPLGVLGGLVRERLSIARRFTDFVSDLAANPSADPQALMASALGDPSLQIAYRRPNQDTYVTLDGRVTAPGAERSREVTIVRRAQRPVAAVTYSPELGGEERYVHAAASAVLLRLESAQLEADLRASAADLQASRIRLVEAAHAERRRIERDLHDTVQQQLVGLRLRLGLAADALTDEPEESRRLLGVVEQQVDDVLATLRNLARGIYPALLAERGIRIALTAVAQRLPLNVAVHADAGVARYPDGLEVAVYFCCLEALQNVVKHGGPDASATVRLCAFDDELYFEVRDTGVGFDDRAVPGGNGLTNMRDRIGAIGGTLSVQSRPGIGTSVTGRVPTGAPPARTP